MAMTKSQRLARKKRTKRAQEAQWSCETAAPCQPAEDPRVVVLDARCRHTGRVQTDDVAGEMWGDLAGRAIAIGASMAADLTAADRRALASDLWDLFKRVDAADETYFRRIIGRARFPNVARLEYIGEVFEAREDEQNSSGWKSEDDKDRDAVRTWMTWQGLLGELPRDAHCAIVSALRQRVMLSHAGRLTGAGEAFVSAMRALMKVERRGERHR